MERWGWLPLLAGVATATAVSRVAGVDTALKWPNDLLVTSAGEAGEAGEGAGEAGEGAGERKAGGILAERAGDGVVVGTGLNVTLTAAELPVPTAARWSWPAPAAPTATRCCAPSCARWRTGTAHGRAPTATPPPAASRRPTPRAAPPGPFGARRTPGGDDLTGEAVAIDGDGRLVLATANGVQRPVGAGDIVHLRPAPPAGPGDGAGHQG